MKPKLEEFEYNNIGFKDESGRVIIPPKFKGVSYFHHGMCPVYIKGLWGIIDSKGKYIIKPQYNEIKILTNDLIGVRKDFGEDWEWNIIDKKGKPIDKLHYKYIEKYYGGPYIIGYNKANIKRFEGYGYGTPSYHFDELSDKIWMTIEGKIIYEGEAIVRNNLLVIKEIF